jgi:hypothetical protein
VDQNFTQYSPTREDFWRSIVLFGRNVASYKFALAKSLLEIAPKEPTFVRLDELAAPFSKHVAEHLAGVDKQGTSSSSRFLDACRKFNRGELDRSGLVDQTVSLGFQNVIDAFHVVNREPIQTRFFTDERKNRGGIVLTDDFFRLKETMQCENLPAEAEARWRLVETAWSLDFNPALLSVRHDQRVNLFFVIGGDQRRVDVTSAKDSLNGYQKGKCFYCFRDISIVPSSLLLADVDHFLPHTLIVRARPEECNLNGVWNLVLSCQECNRGADGKFMRVPKLEYLERLHRRNSYLIDSHHPLRETLMLQTGATQPERRRFLQKRYDWAKSLVIHDWSPVNQLEATF